jgi:uncharacterized protein (TIGR00369 family)
MIKPYEEGIRTVFLVRSEHLNHHGNLFGGEMMAQIDTAAYCLLREEYPEKTFVTRAAEISFERPARIGDVVAFEAHILNLGVTSIQVEVAGSVDGTPVCGACMTYVNIGADGKKASI